MAEAPEAQMTANLMLLMEPPLADQNGFEPAANAYCFAEAPTVHVVDDRGLPDDEYPLASVTSVVTELMTPRVNVAALEALV